ncbi:Uncharacterised protein [Mycobacterium tuberculosis]|nr:Uncharacterised protein [Mycobacterium tuberculosis]
MTGSGHSIALRVIQYASCGVEGVTIRRPAVWANSASGDSEWCSTEPITPPYGMRIVTGTVYCLSVRLWIFASWLVIWL